MENGELELVLPFELLGEGAPTLTVWPDCAEFVGCEDAGVAELANVAEIADVAEIVNVLLPGVLVMKLEVVDSCK